MSASSVTPDPIYDAPRAPAAPVSLLQDVGEGFLRVALHPAVSVVAALGLILGAFVLPPQGAFPETCGMVRAFGLPCPSCGLTRSVTSVFHGEFLAAWQYNPFGFGVAVTFLLLAPLWVLRKKRRELLFEKLRPAAKFVMVAFLTFTFLLVAHGLLRMYWIATGDEEYRWWREARVAPALLYPDAGEHAPH